MAGLVTLVTGVCLSGALTALGMNMLYVAFVTFIYALACLWTVSFFTEKLPATTLDRLVFRRESR